MHPCDGPPSGGPFSSLGGDSDRPWGPIRPPTPRRSEPMSSLVPSPVPATPEAAVAARRPPPQRRARGRDRARPVARSACSPATARPARCTSATCSARSRTASACRTLGVELLVLVADYQTITDRAPRAALPDDVEGQVADYLAAGIDPARATIFAHTPGRGAQPAAAAVPEPRERRRGRPQPDREGRVAAAGGAGDERADVRLSRPPGGRHPVLPARTSSRSAATSCRTSS